MLWVHHTKEQWVTSALHAPLICGGNLWVEPKICIGFGKGESTGPELGPHGPCGKPPADQKLREQKVCHPLIQVSKPTLWGAHSNLQPLCKWSSYLPRLHSYWGVEPRLSWGMSGYKALASKDLIWDLRHATPLWLAVLNLPKLLFLVLLLPTASAEGASFHYEGASMAKAAQLGWGSHLESWHP
jgi:hypothetical protein